MFTSPWLPLLPWLAKAMSKTSFNPSAGAKALALRVVDNMVVANIISYKLSWYLEINTPFSSMEHGGSFKSTSLDAFYFPARVASEFAFSKLTKSLTIRPLVMKWPLTTHSCAPFCFEADFITDSALLKPLPVCPNYYYFSVPHQHAADLPLADLCAMLVFALLCPTGHLNATMAPAVVTAAAANLLLELDATTAASVTGFALKPKSLCCCSSASPAVSLSLFAQI